MTDRDRRAKARRTVRTAAANRDRARRKLLQQRAKLARRRERNRKRVEANREASEGDDERTPSTHSTVPRADSNGEAAARHSTSTVPERPRYSSVPPRRRLYGLGLFRAGEGSGDGADGDGDDGGGTDE
jgi:hypothetical protein